MVTNRSQRGWVLALTCVASFMVALDTLVVVSALPSIQRDLGAGLSTLQWTVNAYDLAYAAGIITAAALGDRLGRRCVFAAGLALFALSSAVCAFAPNIEILIAARAVQGIGATMVTPLSLTIVTIATVATAVLNAVPAMDMGKASGANSTLTTLGGVFGIAGVTAVFAANGHLGTATSFAAGFRPALMLAAGLAVLGAITALGVGRQHFSEAPQTQTAVPAAVNG